MLYYTIRYTVPTMFCNLDSIYCNTSLREKRRTDTRYMMKWKSAPWWKSPWRARLFSKMWRVRCNQTQSPVLLFLWFMWMKCSLVRSGDRPSVIMIGEISRPAGQSTLTWGVSHSLYEKVRTQRLLSHPVRVNADLTSSSLLASLSRWLLHSRHMHCPVIQLD